MKVELIKENLEEVVVSLEKIASKNLSLPVLQCILVSASNNKLKIRATNLDLGVEVDVSAKVIKEGQVAIPAETLKRFLSTIKDKKIEIEEKNKDLFVSSESTSTRIKIFSPEDFPTLPKPESKVGFQMDAKSFSEGLQSVWYSASPGSLKPELSSVYIEKNNGGFVFVATDSFRLAEKKVFGIANEQFEPILIPFKNIPELIKFLNSFNKKAEVNIDGNQIAFSGQDIFITSRTVDGIFPDYKQIIPSDFETEVVILKQDLIEALKASQVFANKFNQVHFEISPSDKKFVIYSKNEEIGENSSNPKTTLKGGEIKICFNHRYIMDCFQSIPQDSVVLKLSGPGKPMVISGVGDDTFTYLIMPMNR